MSNLTTSPVSGHGPGLNSGPRSRPRRAHDVTSRRANSREASATSAAVVTASAAAAGAWRDRGALQAQQRGEQAVRAGTPRVTDEHAEDFSTKKAPTMTRTAADWLRKITPQHTPIRLKRSTANRTAATIWGVMAMLRSSAASIGSPIARPAPRRRARRRGRAGRARSAWQEQPGPPRRGEQALAHGPVAVLAADRIAANSAEATATRIPALAVSGSRSWVEWSSLRSRPRTARRR